MKKLFCIISCLILLTTSLCGCAVREDGRDADKLKIVCTAFPQYDFLRQISGGLADLKMLLKPGAEVHTYEPTPKEIVEISSCDLFVFCGGDSDEWVEDILSSTDNESLTAVKLTDMVETADEPDFEHDGGGHEDEHELDEHVWTSVKNAKKITETLCSYLCESDEKNADTYKALTAQYTARLDRLDLQIRKTINEAKRKEIIVADRFPFLYFCEEYSLKYYAAYPGCSTSTQESAAAMAFLINKVKSDNIPVVFHTELSNENLCDIICESTGAKSRQLNAVHNISLSDFESGQTYISLMEENIEVLKEALN